jgi:hypothetical protein
VIFSANTTFSSACSFFISAYVLIFSGSDIIFFHCFKPTITACTLSSLPYRSCKLPSSEICVHNWPLFSNSFVILCMVCAILSIDSIVSCSHCALTSGGVVGIAHSSISFIWSLYYSKACAIFLIFSSEYTPSNFALFGML